MDDSEQLTESHKASLRRLQAAGVIEDFSVDADGQRWVKFTADYLVLLEAERNPMAEPGMLQAWASGDPARVKEWVEREARTIRGEE